MADKIALRNLIGFALLGIGLVGLENHRCAQLQSRRTAEQAQLLGQLASLNRPAVSELIEDWRLTYPEPNEDRLNELRDLAAQLSTDPDALDRGMSASEPAQKI
ncbi:hypothetical protein C7T35_33070 [Variovorax sp. WS11]|uniref:hypothetical protein n=1 Tax=Variovorax sp. WS11 TaxID=1105204 RepID=UPI000D0D4279|nr:hypothetical protein [Variovorax sp. WS11]NDZ15916.1 hypothetical protein [Variovorax sp. WS11]PSL80318.1 hypothetical protein C7T35_33070 [Variovorax sp. WS11]